MCKEIMRVKGKLQMYKQFFCSVLFFYLSVVLLGWK